MSAVLKRPTGHRIPSWAWLVGLLLWQATSAVAMPRIAIILDDLGNDLHDGRRAIGLEAAVTYAFLPSAPYSVMLAEQAFAEGKEIMLHLPMDSLDDRPLGRDGLTVGMSRRQFVLALRQVLGRIPHIRGVNNHMGSLLTQLPDNMAWLMEELRRQRLYFIDSRTTKATVAEETARRFGVASQRRNIFLDNVPALSAIDRQFDKLLQLARRRGQAIAIGHPYASTLVLLERRLPILEASGVELVPASWLVDAGGRDRSSPASMADSRGMSVSARVSVRH